MHATSVYIDRVCSNIVCQSFVSSGVSIICSSDVNHLFSGAAAALTALEG
jgi:hypothetical protein